MQDHEALTLFGTTQPVVPARRLVAGQLSCLLHEGEVRDVRWGEIEVVRGISYLLRDGDWGTVPATMTEPVIDQKAEAFVVRFELKMRSPTGDLRARARLEGTGEGALVFEVQAIPDGEIVTNRCGFVVLHPAEVAGRELEVEHTDGRRSRTCFPREISPSQPVLDIRDLTYQASEELVVRFRLEAELPGDPAGKFEMEDQRNWSDASFKTYVASLLDPWPYVLPANQSLAQRVHVSVTQLRAAAPASSLSPLVPVALGAPSTMRMPQIGIGIPPGFHRASSFEMAALRELGAQWWMVEADLSDPLVQRDLAAVAALCEEITVSVQVDAIVPDVLSPDDAAEAVAELCARARLAVAAVRLLPCAYLKSYQPSDAWPKVPPLEEYAVAARRHFAGARIGGGMFTNFTELNRKRPPAAGLDFIGHCTCPIVHAADDVSVMQTLEALPHIAQSVRSAWPGLAYRLGPSSIAMRRNPYGDSPVANPRLERIAMASSDPRHGARFGAAWTVAYAAAVSPFGLEVLALHDAHGRSGPVAMKTGSPPSASEYRAPFWDVLRRLVSASGEAIVPLNNVASSTPTVAWVEDDGNVAGLVTNIDGRSCRWRCDQLVEVAGAQSSNEVILDAYETISFVLAVRAHG